jgi:UPF0755 protein
MSKRFSPVILFFGILILSVICLGSGIVGLSVVSMRDEVIDTFGLPSPELSQIERIYLGLQLAIYLDDLKKPRSDVSEPMQFIIENDESTHSVISRLKEKNLIKNETAFRAYLRYTGMDKTLQAGTHDLTPNINSIEIAQALQDVTPHRVRFVIFPGWRLEEIADALPTSGIEIAPEVFVQEASRLPLQYVSEYKAPQTASVEGFLFPASYEFFRKTKSKDMITLLLINFHTQLSDDLIVGFEKQGLTIYQAVILASLIQKEAIVQDEMPLISSVFLNRLQIGMRLDSDPTIQYALGYNEKYSTWWTNPLTADHLALSSPYNTYQNTGLPPGPICNPSLEALKAAAFPAQTPYYYFRASCDNDGRHLFAETFQEHLQNACP